MAKTANAKVIFMPTSNPTLANSLTNGGEGSSKAAAGDEGFGQSINAHLVSEM